MPATAKDTRDVLARRAIGAIRAKKERPALERPDARPLNGRIASRRAQGT